MANNKWVEVEARSIDDAIKAGLNELNLDDATQANININVNQKVAYLASAEQKHS